jgi:undecaprenyl-diphosphatase
MEDINTQVFLWLNSNVGRFPLFDSFIKLAVSDYLLPVLYSVVLLGLWLGSAQRPDRDKIQSSVLVAAVAIGITSLEVMLINNYYFAPRPFSQHEVNLLFYTPTDPSFPANPVAIAFAITGSVWMSNRHLGFLLSIGSTVFAFSRVYAGVFYPVDVIVGAFLGLVTARLLWVVLTTWRPIPMYFIRVMRFFCLA